MLKPFPISCVLMVLVLGCGDGPAAPTPGSSPLLQGASNAPTGSRPLQGTPDPVTGLAPAGSEYRAVQDAIEVLRGHESQGIRELAGCLAVLLKEGQIVVGQPRAGVEAAASTVMNNRAGWQGNWIVLAPGFVQSVVFAIADVNRTASDKEWTLCGFAAALAHEATHANQSQPSGSNPYDQNTWTNEQRKAREGPAVANEKAVLAAWGGGSSVRYQFLCKWIDALCAAAESQPNGNTYGRCHPADRWLAEQAGGMWTPPPAPKGSDAPSRIGHYVSVDEAYSLYVDTGRADGSDRVETIGIAHPTGVALFWDGLHACDYAVVVVGLDESALNTQIQVLAFDRNGFTVSQGAVEVLSGFPVPASARYASTRPSGRS